MLKITIVRIKRYICIVDNCRLLLRQGSPINRSIGLSVKPMSGSCVALNVGISTLLGYDALGRGWGIFLATFVLSKNRKYSLKSKACTLSINFLPSFLLLWICNVFKLEDKAGDFSWESLPTIHCSKQNPLAWIYADVGAMHLTSLQSQAEHIPLRSQQVHFERIMDPLPFFNVERGTPWTLAAQFETSLSQTFSEV